ncbi:endospore germination permease [Desulfotomaculum defluvii]
MDDRIIINSNQLKAIVVCATWPTVINYGSGFLAREVGIDMWLSGAIGVITAIPLIYISLYISRNFPGRTIVEYSHDLLGILLGKLMGLILTIYFLLYAVSAISMYIHHLTDFLLPETPFLVVTILHVLVITYFVWHGPGVIAKMGIVAFTMAILFHFLVFLASLPEIDYSEIRPFFDSGLVEVSKASLTVHTFIGMIWLFIPMLLPSISDQEKSFRSIVIGLAIGGFFFVFYFIVEIMIMGPQVVALMRIASMDFVRSIQITQYLHRFESFMVALWYWSILVQAGTLTYCALAAFMQTVGIKEKKPSLFIFLAIILVVLTYYMAYDRVFFLNLREFDWKYYSLPIQFGIPTILLIALGFKKMFAKY